MRAIVNVNHMGCLGSLKKMMASIGIEISQLNDVALAGLETKTNMSFGAKRLRLILMGYKPINVSPARMSDLKDCELYVDIKEERLDKIKKLYPHLKLLHFIINGGKEYGKSKYPTISANKLTKGFIEYLPFLNNLNLKPREKIESFDNPIGLLQNPYNWGFGMFIDEAEKMGINIYGEKGTTSGVVNQEDLPQLFSKAKAFVHFKGTDCPGFALYEAFASGVPIILPHMFIDRTLFYELYQSDKTCLTSGKYAYKHNPNNPDRPLNECWRKVKKRVLEEIRGYLEQLDDPEENYRIGMNGYKKWKEVTMWTENKADRLEQYLKSCQLI